MRLAWTIAVTCLIASAAGRPRAKPQPRGNSLVEEIEDTIKPEPFTSQGEPTSTLTARSVELVGNVLLQAYSDLERSEEDTVIAQTAVGTAKLLPIEESIKVQVNNGNTLVREYREGGLQYFLDPAFEETASGVTFNAGATQKFGYESAEDGRFVAMDAGKARIQVVPKDGKLLLNVFGNLTFQE